MERKPAFATTFLGGILVLVIGGLVVELSTRLLPPEREPPSAAEPNGEGTARDVRAIQLPPPAATPPPAESDRSPEATALDGQPPQRPLDRPTHAAPAPAAPTEQTPRPRGEIVRLTDGEAVALTAFAGDASVTFGRLGEVTFATVIIAPSQGPLIREPVYESGRAFSVRSGAQTFQAQVMTVDFSSKSLTLRLTAE